MALQGSVLFQPRSLVRYRKHPTSASNSSQRLRDGQLLFRDKWLKQLRLMKRTRHRRILAQAFIFDRYLAAVLVKRACLALLRQGRWRDGVMRLIDACKKYLKFCYEGVIFLRYV
jgi:hypothetical protein